MCGICGNFNASQKNRIDPVLLRRMAYALKHRGPDGFGIYSDNDIGLGHARLSIIDLAGGGQPIHNEDKSVWIVFNGEIFNYIELREVLEKKGHRFSTRTDTEVIVHLYEDKGTDCLRELNGQFALAIWDSRKKQLFLARDRMGIRPLFYTSVDGSLLFASEIKSLLSDTRVKAEMDPVGLDQLFTFWATVPPRTTFKNISELPPAHYLLARAGAVEVKRYWDARYMPPQEAKSETYYAERLFELLMDSIKIRLRADVPVAAYLSGGLDSSFIAALVKKYLNNHLQTFSVSFSDKDYDESSYQRSMADFLGTDHREIRCGYRDIGAVMPQVVWHAEKPLIRTAPAPMFMLSKLVRENNMKVVLTGEGADEILGGYDLFKEMKIRRFWARNPGSQWRPKLFKKLYGHVQNWPRQAPNYLEAFYKNYLGSAGAPHFSHVPRWTATQGIKNYYSAGMREALKGQDSIADFTATLPAESGGWDHLALAQYIEMQTILSGNLLSSQGDRMALAHSVEGRYPFLDYRLVEFCFSLPPSLKLKVLQEKYLLKKIAKPYLPGDISKRTKQAYRSPDSASFFHGTPLPYVEEALSAASITAGGYFDPAAVSSLAAKCRSTDPALIGNKHNMTVTAIVTTQLVDALFMKGFNQTPMAEVDKAAFTVIK